MCTNLYAHLSIYWHDPYICRHWAWSSISTNTKHFRIVWNVSSQAMSTPDSISQSHASIWLRWWPSGGSRQSVLETEYCHCQESRGVPRIREERWRKPFEPVQPVIVDFFRSFCTTVLQCKLKAPGCQTHRRHWRFWTSGPFAHVQRIGIDKAYAPFKVRW